MSKPGWIRFLGWLSLFLLVMPLTWPIAEYVSGHALARSNLPGYMWAAFVPVFVFWLIASLISGIVRYSAKMKAQAREQALRRAVAGANPPKDGTAATREAGQTPWGTAHHLTPPPSERP